MAKNTLLELKEKEIRYLVLYHQKTLLNALFFKEEKIFFQHHKWLYRVYFYRKIDLDFFKYLNRLFQKVTSHYIAQKAFYGINKLLEHCIQEHNIYVKNAPKKQILPNYEEDAQELVEVLLSGDIERCGKILEQSVSSLEAFVVYFDTIIQSAMIQIGYMWETTEVSVAKEHLASATLYDALVLFLEGFQTAPFNNIEIFISSAPYEHHGLGIKIASIVLKKLGYKVTNLGVDLPSKEIFRAIAEFQPDYFLLVATLSSNRLDAALLIYELQKSRQYTSKAFEIGIAGNAFKTMFQPAKVLKADFYAQDLQALLQILQ